MKRDLRSLNLNELEEEIVALDEKKFRAIQIFDWMHNKLIDEFSQMSNVPNSLIDKLSESFMIYPVKKEKMQESQIDGTRKYLFRLHDDEYVESVFMRYSHGNSVCVSSQVGCRMGCKFCASTIGGLVRNLTAGEILAEVYEIIKDTKERVSNVVIMGTGEPFDNYENVVSLFVYCLMKKDLI